MGLIKDFIKRIRYQTPPCNGYGTYEFCPRCDANLTLQRGYNNALPYWICKGCGETLINPEVPGDVAWICDKCKAMLNIQKGFSENLDEWECSECGYLNKINRQEIYYSEAEFDAAFSSPYRGLSDDDVLELSDYSEVEAINNRDDIVVVKGNSDGKLYVKKILSTYDTSVYRYLMEHPIKNMPQIIDVFESENNLIIIEEYITGRTLLEILNDKLPEYGETIRIIKSICNITRQLHNLEKPIIHRDIKPSNVIITNDGEVYLLDINAAKWYKENETEDTKLIGTQYYAAPEQLGYGFTASSEKSDIYAIGILINVMLTGKLPKEEKALGNIWPVIEKCICLDPKDRCSDKELEAMLNELS